MNIVDIGKYENLPKDAKEILYRPPKVRKLFEKYWALVKAQTGLELEKNPNDDLNKYKAKYP